MKRVLCLSVWFVSLILSSQAVSIYYYSNPDCLGSVIQPPLSWNETKPRPLPPSLMVPEAAPLAGAPVALGVPVAIPIAITIPEAPPLPGTVVPVALGIPMAAPMAAPEAAPVGGFHDFCVATTGVDYILIEGPCIAGHEYTFNLSTMADCSTSVEVEVMPNQCQNTSSTMLVCDDTAPNSMPYVEGLLHTDTTCSDNSTTQSFVFANSMNCTAYYGLLTLPTTRDVTLRTRSSDVATYFILLDELCQPNSTNITGTIYDTPDCSGTPVTTFNRTIGCDADTATGASDFAMVSCTYPDTLLPSGALQEPDGTIIEPDGTMIQPDGTIIEPNGAILEPNGTLVEPDGTVVQPAPGGALVPSGDASALSFSLSLLAILLSSLFFV